MAVLSYRVKVQKERLRVRPQGRRKDHGWTTGLHVDSECLHFFCGAVRPPRDSGMFLLTFKLR